MTIGRSLLPPEGQACACYEQPAGYGHLTSVAGPPGVIIPVKLSIGSSATPAKVNDAGRPHPWQSPGGRV
jgi:hypothetical protein